MFTMPMIDMEQTGKRIIELRKSASMTVKNLQDIFGFATPNAIYKWQNGETMPTIDNLVILSAIFGVPLDEIVVTDRKVCMQKSA